MYFHHVRDITVSGFSAEANPNTSAPSADKLFRTGKIDKPQGHALYLRLVDNGGADVVAATASFTPWFKDENSGAWLSATPVVAAPSSRLQFIPMTGDAFVQVTALGSVGSSVTVQVYAAEVTGDEAIDGEVMAASARIAGDAEIGGDLDVGGDATVGGDLDVGGDLAVTGTVTGRGGGDTALAFRTPITNLAALTNGTVQVIPSISGYYAESVLLAAYATSGAGTCTTGPTLSFGNNAGEDNIGPSTAITAAAVNAGIAAGFPCRIGGFAIISGTTTKQLLNLSTPVTLKITTQAAGTGGFALSGYVLAVVTLRPI